MKHLIWMAASALLVACGGSEGSRPIVEQDGIPFAATCGGDSDCGGQADSCCIGGKCSPDGWCSPKCSSDHDCPIGFYCIDHSGTRCFSSCEDDRDCPINFVCEEKSGHKTCRYK